MPGIHMVIADEDEEYICRLSQWFRENRAHQFKVSVFTGKESFNKFLIETDHEIDVVLAASGFISPEQSHWGNTIVLGLPENVELSDLPYVEKYQSASALSNHVLSIVSTWHKELVKWNTAKSELILCCSPDPRLKSTLALLLAMHSSRHVYMNFESFPFYLLNADMQQCSRNLSDILYHIKASRGNIGIALESTIYTDSTGINFVPPMENPADLWELSDSENEILLESLLSWGHFSRIIADIEWNTTTRTTQWLEAASMVLIPFNQSQTHQIIQIKNMLENMKGVYPDNIKWIKAGNFNFPFDNRMENIINIPNLKSFEANWRHDAVNSAVSEQISDLLTIKN